MEFSFPSGERENLNFAFFHFFLFIFFSSVDGILVFNKDSWVFINIISFLAYCFNKGLQKFHYSWRGKKYPNIMVDIFFLFCFFIQITIICQTFCYQSSRKPIFCFIFFGCSCQIPI